jgi:hypothetical protein
MGIELYSKVPNRIKNSESFFSFQKRLKILFTGTLLLYNKLIC